MRQENSDMPAWQPPVTTLASFFFFAFHHCRFKILRTWCNGAGRQRHAPIMVRALPFARLSLSPFPITRLCIRARVRYVCLVIMYRCIFLSLSLALSMFMIYSVFTFPYNSLAHKGTREVCLFSIHIQMYFSLSLSLSKFVIYSVFTTPYNSGVHKGTRVVYFV